MSKLMVKSNAKKGKKLLKNRKVRPIETIELNKQNKKCKLKNEAISPSQDTMIFGVARSTLLIEITNGMNWKKSRTPSPIRCGTHSLSDHSEMEYDDCGVVVIGSGSREAEGETSGKMTNVELDIDTAAPIQQSNSEITQIQKLQNAETSISTQNKSNSIVKEESHLFGRISEKAAKYLPKTSNFGKFFGEKEKDISISTIDREMGRNNDTQKCNKSQHYTAEFSNSELADRLRRTKVPSNPNIARFKSVGCLAMEYPPQRLYFLPVEEWRDPESLVTTIVRVILCQATLIILLLIWILFGALLFYLTEGPSEYSAVEEFHREERSLAISLATDLRLQEENKLNNGEELSLWDSIEKYTALHKNIVLKSVQFSYGKQRPFWTYSGSFLFATSVLTTFGIATPLPATDAGKLGAFIFTILGLPLQLMLIIHLGRTIALKVQLLAKEIEVKFYEMRRRISNVRKFGEDIGNDKNNWQEKLFLEEFKPPEWLCHLPIFNIFLYYLIGCFLFGLWEGFPYMFLFPNHFSSLNYQTTDLARFGYACYLEGLAILIAVNVTIWRDSPYSGLSVIGNNLRFMTNSLE